MAERTKIEWAEASWNPVTGCTPISEGCCHCYARRIAERFWGKRSFYDVRFHEDRLDIPFRWKKPMMVFVGSMGDLFHQSFSIRGSEMREIFRTMASCAHVFMLLTKRPKRMARAISNLYGNEMAEAVPNIWLGVTVESPDYLHRVEDLLQVPAAVHFVSCEPLLEPIDFNSLSDGEEPHLNLNALTGLRENPFGAIVTRGFGPKLDWVIVGGETGPGARHMNPDWARRIRDQCREAEVPFFMKQMSRKQPIPDDLMVREHPHRCEEG